MKEVSKIGPFSGSKQMSGEEAANQPCISGKLKGNIERSHPNVSYQASAAAQSWRVFSHGDPDFSPERFNSIYGISLEEAQQLESLIYGGEK